MSKKLFLAAALSLLALVASAGTASAFTAAVEPAGTISSVSEGKVIFASGSTRIECNLTLRGSLNSRVTLTAGQSLGTITGVEARECSAGATVTVLATPWTLEYTSTEGTLPNAATAVNFNVLRAAFRLSLFGGFINCLYEGNQPSILSVSGTNPYTSGVITIEPVSLPRRAGSGCPATGSMSGTFRGLSPSQRITVS